MKEIRLGEKFWTKVEAAFRWEQGLLDKKAFLVDGPDMGMDRELRTKPVWHRVRSLYFSSNPLVDRMYFSAPDAAELADAYWRRLHDQVLNLSANDLWDQVTEDENRSCLVGALRTGYIIALMLNAPAAKAALQTAVDISYRRLSEGEFTKEFHERGGKVNEDYFNLATEMLPLWLLNAEASTADHVWQTRMQNLGKSLLKTRAFKYFRCMLALTRLGMDQTPKDAIVAEGELLDLQLLWLKWLPIDPLVDIRMTDLVVAEIIFQRLRNNAGFSVQDALNNQRPEQVRKRYERLVAV